MKRVGVVFQHDPVVMVDVDSSRQICHHLDSFHPISIILAFETNEALAVQMMNGKLPLMNFSFTIGHSNEEKPINPSVSATDQG